MPRRSPSAASPIAAFAFGLFLTTLPQFAHAEPQMLVPQLGVRPVVQGLELPINVAFLGDDDMLVLEKNSGRVLRVTNGEVQGPVLDLAVNFFSERGLLGIALHPDFPENPAVYLFWTCRAAPPPPEGPFFPEAAECPDTPELGADTGDVLAVPLLANRVDRFLWNGSSLTFDHNLIKLRAFQNDAAPEPPNQGDAEQPARGNHDGGILRFGPDGKLYVLFGDQGRRGQLQNLPSGPTLTGLGPVVPDDQFGGPQPDDAHFSGVILRLNDDGTTPSDNPFVAAGAAIGGEVGENVKRIFAYGIRNSFGMAFDPIAGALWLEENGEDAFDELNRVDAGFNSGWIQIAGPLSRIGDFRGIETTSLHAEDFPNLQQFRWGPERIALTAEEARSRFFELPGSQYSDPELSWKNVIAPAAIGFARGDGLGRNFTGDLFMGLSVPTPLGGPLLRIQLAGNRRQVAVDDPRLEDLVADNPTFFDLTESESMVVGRDFGIVTEIQTGPNGNLYVVSLSDGAIYEIFRTTGPAAHRPPREAIDASTSIRVEQAASDARDHVIQLVTGASGRARVTVHNISGRIVAELWNDYMEQGERRIPWMASGITPGVYFVRLELSVPGTAPVARVAKLISLN